MRGLICLGVCIPLVAWALKCPPGQGVYQRTDSGMRVVFCGKIAAVCPSGDLTESISISVKGKPACALAEGEAHYENIDGSSMEMSYRNGVLHGKVISFAKGRKKLLEESYDHGLKSGKRTEYYDLTGNKRLEENYRNGIREGIAESYYPNGKLKTRSPYKNGKKHGKTEEWYENGNRRSETHYLSGVWWGKFNEYYSSGKPYSESEYRNNRREGITKLWHPNGQLMSQRKYTANVLQGPFFQWDISGQKVGDWEYEQGKLKEVRTHYSGRILNSVLSGCGELASSNMGFSNGEGKCLKLDANGDGHTDIVVNDSKKTQQSLVILLVEGRPIKELIIPESIVELYPIRSEEGQFGEPATNREGLVVWGRNSNTRVYLYDFDKEVFLRSEHASDM